VLLAAAVNEIAADVFTGIADRLVGADVGTPCVVNETPEEAGPEPIAFTALK
jgi:hypothetical protein